MRQIAGARTSLSRLLNCVSFAWILPGLDLRASSNGIFFLFCRYLQHVYARTSRNRVSTVSIYRAALGVRPKLSPTKYVDSAQLRGFASINSAQGTVDGSDIFDRKRLRYATSKPNDCDSKQHRWGKLVDLDVDQIH
jgi:hypothetical protein